MDHSHPSAMEIDSPRVVRVSVLSPVLAPLVTASGGVVDGSSSQSSLTAAACANDAAAESNSVEPPLHLRQDSSATGSSDSGSESCAAVTATVAASSSAVPSAPSHTAHMHPHSAAAATDHSHTDPPSHAAPPTSHPPPVESDSSDRIGWFGLCEILLQKGPKYAGRVLAERVEQCARRDKPLSESLLPYFLRHFFLKAQMCQLGNICVSDWCLHILCGGSSPATFLKQLRARSLDSPQTMCAKFLAEGEFVYSCRTCQLSTSSVICTECFQQGQHEGHDCQRRSMGAYSLEVSSGGTCDCGDAGWKSSGMCATHRAHHVSAAADRLERQRVESLNALLRNADHIARVTMRFRIRVVLSTLVSYVCVTIHQLSPSVTHQRRFTSVLKVLSWTRKLCRGTSAGSGSGAAAANMSELTDALGAAMCEPFQTTIDTTIDSHDYLHRVILRPPKPATDAAKTEESSPSPSPATPPLSATALHPITRLHFLLPYCCLPLPHFGPTRLDRLLSDLCYALLPHADFKRALTFALLSQHAHSHLPSSPYTIYRRLVIAQCRLPSIVHAIILPSSDVAQTIAATSPVRAMIDNLRDVVVVATHLRRKHTTDDDPSDNDESGYTRLRRYDAAAATAPATSSADAAPSAISPREPDEGFVRRHERRADLVRRGLELQLTVDASRRHRMQELQAQQQRVVDNDRRLFGDDPAARATPAPHIFRGPLVLPTQFIEMRRALSERMRMLSATPAVPPPTATITADSTQTPVVSAAAAAAATFIAAANSVAAAPPAATLYGQSLPDYWSSTAMVPHPPVVAPTGGRLAGGGVGAAAGDASSPPVASSATVWFYNRQHSLSYLLAGADYDYRVRQWNETCLRYTADYVLTSPLRSSLIRLRLALGLPLRPLTVDASSPIIANHVFLTIKNDLMTLLDHSLVARGAFDDAATMTRFLSFCALLSSMNPQKRQVGAHVAFEQPEAEMKNYFYLEIAAHKCFEKMIDAGAECTDEDENDVRDPNSPSAAPAPLDDTTDAFAIDAPIHTSARTRLDTIRSHLHNFGNHLIFDFLAHRLPVTERLLSRHHSSAGCAGTFFTPISGHDLETPISVHQPVHRMFARAIAHAITRSDRLHLSLAPGLDHLVQFTSILDDIDASCAAASPLVGHLTSIRCRPLAFWLCFLESPLRVTAFMSQLRSRSLWIRNGFDTISSLQKNYRNSANFWRRGYGADLAAIQIAAVEIVRHARDEDEEVRRTWTTAASIPPIDAADQLTQRLLERFQVGWWVQRDTKGVPICTASPAIPAPAGFTPHEHVTLAEDFLKMMHGIVCDRSYFVDDDALLRCCIVHILVAYGDAITHSQVVQFLPAEVSQHRVDAVDAALASVADFTPPPTSPTTSSAAKCGVYRLKDAYWQWATAPALYGKYAPHEMVLAEEKMRQARRKKQSAKRKRQAGGGAEESGKRSKTTEGATVAAPDAMENTPSPLPMDTTPASSFFSLPPSPCRPYLSAPLSFFDASLALLHTPTMHALFFTTLSFAVRSALSKTGDDALTEKAATTTMTVEPAATTARDSPTPAAPIGTAAFDFQSGQFLSGPAVAAPPAAAELPMDRMVQQVLQLLALALTYAPNCSATDEAQPDRWPPGFVMQPSWTHLTPLAYDGDERAHAVDSCQTAAAAPSSSFLPPSSSSSARLLCLVSLVEELWTRGHLAEFSSEMKSVLMLAKVRLGRDTPAASDQLTTDWSKSASSSVCTPTLAAASVSDVRRAAKLKAKSRQQKLMARMSNQQHTIAKHHGVTVPQTADATKAKRSLTPRPTTNNSTSGAAAEGAADLGQGVHTTVHTPDHAMSPSPISSPVVSPSPSPLPPPAVSDLSRPCSPPDHSLSSPSPLPSSDAHFAAARCCLCHEGNDAASPDASVVGASATMPPSVARVLGLVCFLTPTGLNAVAHRATHQTIARRIDDANAIAENGVDPASHLSREIWPLTTPPLVHHRSSHASSAATGATQQITFDWSHSLGLHLQTCNRHYLHIGCLEAYLASKYGRATAPGWRQGAPFLCPACRRLSNVILPIGVDQLSASQTNGGDGDTNAAVVDMRDATGGSLQPLSRVPPPMQLCVATRAKTSVFARSHPFSDSSLLAADDWRQVESWLSWLTHSMRPHATGLARDTAIALDDRSSSPSTGASLAQATGRVLMTLSQSTPPTRFAAPSYAFIGVIKHFIHIVTHMLRGQQNGSGGTTGTAHGAVDNTTGGGGGRRRTTHAAAARAAAAELTRTRPPNGANVPVHLVMPVGSVTSPPVGPVTVRQTPSPLQRSPSVSPVPILLSPTTPTPPTVADVTAAAAPVTGPATGPAPTAAAATAPVDSAALHADREARIDSLFHRLQELGQRTAQMQLRVAAPAGAQTLRNEPIDAGAWAAAIPPPDRLARSASTGPRILTISRFPQPSPSTPPLPSASLLAYMRIFLCIMGNTCSIWELGTRDEAPAPADRHTLHTDETSRAYSASSPSSLLLARSTAVFGFVPSLSVLSADRPSTIGDFYRALPKRMEDRQRQVFQQVMMMYRLTRQQWVTQRVHDPQTADARSATTITAVGDLCTTDPVEVRTIAESRSTATAACTTTTATDQLDDLLVLWQLLVGADDGSHTNTTAATTGTEMGSTASHTAAAEASATTAAATSTATAASAVTKSNSTSASCPPSSSSSSCPPMTLPLLSRNLFSVLVQLTPLLLRLAVTRGHIAASPSADFPPSAMPLTPPLADADSTPAAHEHAISVLRILYLAVVAQSSAYVASLGVRDSMSSLSDRSAGGDDDGPMDRPMPHRKRKSTEPIPPGLAMPHSTSLKRLRLERGATVPIDQLESDMPLQANANAEDAPIAGEDDPDGSDAIDADGDPESSLDASDRAHADARRSDTVPSLVAWQRASDRFALRTSRLTSPDALLLSAACITDVTSVGTMVLFARAARLRLIDLSLPFEMHIDQQRERQAAIDAHGGGGGRTHAMGRRPWTALADDVDSGELHAAVHHLCTPFMRQASLFLSAVFDMPPQTPADADSEARSNTHQSGTIDFERLFPSVLRSRDDDAAPGASFLGGGLGPSCHRLLYAWYQSLYLPVATKRAIAAGANQGRRLAKTRFAATSVGLGTAGATRPTPSPPPVPRHSPRGHALSPPTILTDHTHNDRDRHRRAASASWMGAPSHLASPPRLSAEAPRNFAIHTQTTVGHTDEGQRAASDTNEDTTATPQHISPDPATFAGSASQAALPAGPTLPMTLDVRPPAGSGVGTGSSIVRWTLSSFSPFQSTTASTLARNSERAATSGSVPLTTGPQAMANTHTNMITAPTAAAAAATTLTLTRHRPPSGASLPSSSLPPFPCVSGDVGDSFSLCGLPPTLHSFFTDAASHTCVQCRQRKYALNTSTGAQNLSVCLLCGACVCLTGASAVGGGASSTGGGPHAKCYLQHLLKCDGRIGLYLMLKRGGEVLCLLHSTGGTAACFWPSLYLDRYGESDHGLQRGRPLFRHAGRVRALTRQYTDMALQDYITSHAAPLQVTAQTNAHAQTHAHPFAALRQMMQQHMNHTAPVAAGVATAPAAAPTGASPGAAAAASAASPGAVTVMPMSAISHAARPRTGRVQLQLHLPAGLLQLPAGVADDVTVQPTVHFEFELTAVEEQMIRDNAAATATAAAAAARQTTTQTTATTTNNGADETATTAERQRQQPEVTAAAPTVQPAETTNATGPETVSRTQTPPAPEP